MKTIRKKIYYFLYDVNEKFDKINPIIASLILIIPVIAFIVLGLGLAAFLYFYGFVLWRSNHQGRQREKFLNEHITIPIKPSNGLLFSMAMRYDHSFGMDCDLTDEEILKERAEGNFFAGNYKTKREKECIISTMRQLHEEVVGTGFYKYKS